MSTQQLFITELLGSHRNCALIHFYTQCKMPTHTHDTKNQYLNYTQRLKWYYLLRIVWKLRIVSIRLERNCHDW